VAAEIVFWTASLLLGWVYLGYPVFVAAIGKVRPFRPRPVGPRPSVTVAVAVHDEADEIADRIANVLAQDPEGKLIIEVLVGSDGSIDGTDAAVRTIAETNPRVRLLALERGGQTATQDAMFRVAHGDVVLLTDAETRFATDCVERLADVFRDPRVGCATGRLEWRAEDATATSANEGAYWRYERAVRAAESRAGFLTAVTGAVLAVRRSGFRPVPPTASMDHLLPLYSRAAGSLVVYVAGALATDRPMSGIREQFRNRVRTATQGIEANLSMVRELAPWRYPRAAVAVWTHKILRWATPWLALAAVVSATILGIGGQPAYFLAPALVVVGGLSAAMAQLISRSGREPARLVAFPRAFAVVNLAFAVAWLNVVRGKQIAAWHRAEWEARAGRLAKPRLEHYPQKSQPVAEVGALLRNPRGSAADSHRNVDHT
jgi:cellulose synthase/poly-beta-1,6-N-acetylglucosamine synthase-like glycosyltransferase